MDWKTRLPGLSGNANVDMKRVLDYSFQLSEEIRYYLNNLDLSHFNQVEWAKYEEGLLAIAAEEMNLQLGKLEIKFSDADKALETKINATVDGLKTTVTNQGKAISALDSDLNDVAEDLTIQISEVEQTATKIQSTVSSQGADITSMKSQITQNANSISAVVTGIGDVNGNVSAASIVAAINAAGSSVQIAADHIDLTGSVNIKSVGEERMVQIYGGDIMFGNGHLYCLNSGAMTLTSNSHLYLEAVDGYVYALSGGHSWALLDNGWTKLN